MTIDLTAPKMFYVLQNPTRRGVQAYIKSDEPGFIYKGPYSESRVETLERNYHVIKELSREIYMDIYPLSPEYPQVSKVWLKGPNGEFLSKPTDNYVLEENYFLKMTNLGIPNLEKVKISSTKMGFNHMIENRVDKVDFTNPKQVIQLIIQGLIRKKLKIGDAAVRNFLVKDGIVYQIDIDNQSESSELFPKYSKANLSQISKVYEENSKDLDLIESYLNEVCGVEEFVTKNSPSPKIKIKDARANVPKVTTSETDFQIVDIPKLQEARREALKEKASVYFTNLDNAKILQNFPTFVLKEMPETFRECRNFSSKNCGVFLMAWMALYNYGFHTSRKGHSITWVRTSIYTALMEDMSINFLQHKLEEAIEIMEELEKASIAKTPETLQMAYQAGLRTYQLLSSGVKTRELSFWLIVNKYPVERLREFECYSGLYKKIKNLNLTDPKLLKHKLLKKIYTSVKPMLARCLVAQELFNHYEMEDFKTTTLRSKPDFDGALFTGSEEIIPVVGYRQEKTGYTFLQDEKQKDFGVYLAKSILQKAFRVGLPLHSKHFSLLMKIKFENRAEMLLEVPKHYSEDKHVPVSNRQSYLLKPDYTFLTCGMRSSVAEEVVEEGQNLYQVAILPYFKMMEMGVKATSKNL